MQLVPDARAYRERLTGVSSASLADALARLRAHRAHLLDLVTPTPGRVLFGPAATLAFVPLRDDAPDPKAFSFDRLYHEAVGPDPAGRVLVCANYGPPTAAVAGGKRLALMERDGLAGLLTNGRLRDFQELREYGFAAYCTGETPYAGSREVMPVAARVPVAVGPVTVFPGDFVYADGAGAVILPRADLDRALELAASIEAEDARSVEAVLGASRDGR
ncbi:MAG TPA: RraA family protein [Candidatus Thermoplasmatota archaeon]|nr:RraA family protein [Candidatus Thermoplasmatota archaeon]